jgi:hypothetical protein
MNHINTDGLDAIARFVKENPRFVYSGITVKQTHACWYAAVHIMEIGNAYIEIDEIRDADTPYEALCKIGAVIDDHLEVLGLPKMMGE